MSLIPPGTAPSFAINLYSSVQVAVTTAALYDHALSLGREIELIWMKPLSLVTALYVIERYLGDVVLIAGLCLCLSVSMSEEEYVNVFGYATSDLYNVISALDLFEFRAWGALVYAWATQATMQLRIYALYRRSKRVLALLLTMFLCEIAAIAFIIWREIGPNSHFQADNTLVHGEHFCLFSGVNDKFVYFFVPFLCFELFLFLLAARMFVETTRRDRERVGDKSFQANSFMSILARDSICYFFVNLVACAVVMGLWRGVTVLYANICVPLAMLLEVLVGTRLILDFRERYARSEWDTLSGRSSPLLFRDDMRLESTSISVQCQVETIVVTDGINEA